jgi:hypothetical protein
MILENPSFAGVFFPAKRPPSVKPSAEMSFQGAVAVPESYRIDEFRNTLRAVSISVVYRGNSEKA